MIVKLFYSFEATGRNKKESEEQVAQQALTVLHDTNIISPTGKLLCELNTHKTLQSNSSPCPITLTDGPVSDSVGHSATKEGIFLH